MLLFSLLFGFWICLFGFFLWGGLQGWRVDMERLGDKWVRAQDVKFPKNQLRNYVNILKKKAAQFVGRKKLIGS